jgi:chemotaxis protein methyltransferase CheR
VIAESEIVKVSEQIELKLGLHFPENRLVDLKKVILSTLPELGFGHRFEDFYRALSLDALSQMQYDILATHLTIGETYFFRENASLQALIKTILPPLIEERSHKNRNIRIWSAGCCTGEEAYTIAILLSELIPDIDSWNITIIGTDINRNFIHKAKSGRYTQWSFRVTPIDILNRYFIKVDKAYEVIPHIKKMVAFSYLNLVEDKYPSAATNTENMDVIFCRNVIMYFSDEQRIKVLHRFTQSLTNTGWLISSPVEVLNEVLPYLKRVNIDEAILYHKDLLFEKMNKAVFPFQPENAFPSLSDSGSHKLKSKNVSRTPNDSLEIKKQKELFDESVKEEKHILQRAERYYKQGYYKEALVLFKKLYHQNPADYSTLYYLSKSSANLGYHAEARLWCEKLILNDSMNANYYYLLATILLELNETQLAEETLKKVLYLDPQHVLAHFVIGNWNLNQGKKKEAQKHYQNLKNLLNGFQEDWVIPESDGLTVARLKEIIGLF